MKIVIDTGNYKPQEKDLIVYRNGEWTIIQASEFLKEQDNKLFAQDKKIDNFIKDINEQYESCLDKINKIAKATKDLIGD